MKFRLPPLNALRSFEAAARHMSFKKAADELCVTPAAISHQIKTIEEYLGVELFLRQNRSLELTEHGKRCFLGVSEGFSHLANAMSWVGADSRDTKHLVITAGPAVTAKRLVPGLPKFSEKHPDIQTRISASLAFCDFAKDGVDVAIRFGHVNAPGLYVERLIEEAIVPMCSPTLRTPQGGPVTQSDLPQVRLIHDESLRMVEPSCAGWAEWLQAAGIIGVDPTRGLRFNHADHALQAAVEGAGVVLGRVVLATPDLQAGRLVIPFGPQLASKLHFHLVCSLEKSRSATVKLFRDWLFEEVGSTPISLPAAEPAG